jgi:hypothetical protein
MFQVITMPARTLAWWLDQENDIDFAPIYQRKSRIWSMRDKQFLIDSIINEFDIPKIYLADFTFMNTVLNRANKKYAIIDGKQRFETIFDFFRGELFLSNDFELADDPSQKLGGLSFKDLSQNYPRIARKFENYNLTVMSVITDDESKINELFVRLNSSRPLTGAELRNAALGRVPEMIRNIVAHDFFTAKIRFDTKRSQDKNLAAKLLLIEHRGQLVDTKKSQLDRLVEEPTREQTGVIAVVDEDEEGEEPFVENDAESQIEETVQVTESPDIESSTERVKSVLGRMVEVFADKDPLLSNQAPIIPYYWLIRGLAEDRLKYVRTFLVDFEQKLKVNRALPPDANDRRDVELDSYYTMGRTSNDAASMRGRYRILRERFDKSYPPTGNDAARLGG